MAFPVLKLVGARKLVDVELDRVDEEEGRNDFLLRVKVVSLL